MNIHVAIATTQGIALVEDLEREDENDDFRACAILGGASGAGGMLGAMSHAYWEFVKPEAGVIKRDFGHSSWRLVLGRDIESGKSWQLGVYIAHWLNANGMLGRGEVGEGDLVVLATGKVDRKLNTIGVPEVPRKIKRARGEIGRWHTAGAKVVFVADRSHEDEVPADIFDEVRLISTVDELADLLGERPAIGDASSIADEPAEPAPTPDVLPAPVVAEESPRRTAALAVPAFLVLGLAAFYGFQTWQLPGQEVAMVEASEGVAGTEAQPEKNTETRDSDAIVGRPVGEASPRTDREVTLPLDDFGDVAREAVKPSSGFTFELQSGPWNCDINEIESQTIYAAENVIPPVSLDGFCGLRVPATGFDAAFIYAHDSRVLIELEWRGGAYLVSRPSRTDTDRAYSLILLDRPMTPPEIERLYNALDDSFRGSSGDITVLMTKIGIGGRVYDHRLVAN